MTIGTAYTRALSPRIGDCALTHLDRVAIDVARAEAEHAAYEAALAAAGFAIVRLPDLPDAPDGVFVEDTAILLGEHAIVTRPGAASRAGETESTAVRLAEDFHVHRLAAGTLDGGDVLRVDRTLHVGLSARSNRDGIAALSGLVYPLGYRVVAVEMQGCLHLKTAATFAGHDGAGAEVLVYNPDWIAPSDFKGVEAVPVAAGEAAAANVLRVGDSLLIAAGNPRTAEMLAARGFAVVEVDNGELQKAEAGLTCCSLIAQRD